MMRQGNQEVIQATQTLKTGILGEFELCGRVNVALLYSSSNSCWQLLHCVLLIRLNSRLILRWCYGLEVSYGMFWAVNI